MTRLTTAEDFLKHGQKVLKQRGEENGYNKSNEPAPGDVLAVRHGPRTQCSSERSFDNVASAFTAITGRYLLASDVALILQILKDVRQYAQPRRFHEDSMVDKVNYAALHAEVLRAELEPESDCQKNDDSQNLDQLLDNEYSTHG